MTYADPQTINSSPYSAKDITVIICARLTEQNPWIIKRLDFYSTWFRPLPQILVVDFGSEPSYAKKIKRICATHHYSYHYENNTDTFSLSLARNVGFLKSKTDLVFFTDPDFIFERNIFQHLLKVANALNLDSNYMNRITMPAYHLTQAYSELFEQETWDPEIKEQNLIRWMHHGVYTEYNKTFEYISPYSNNFLCHRSFYNLVGGYSTDFTGHGSEDFEFIIRSNLISNTLPLPQDLSEDTYNPSELHNSTEKYKGFRRLAEAETFSDELHGFRSFHLWHPRLASKGWYENNDRKRKVFNSVISRYNNRINLLKEDYLPRNKRALCIISDDSQLLGLLSYRLKGFTLDILSRHEKINEIVERINTKTYEEVFYQNKQIKKEYSILFESISSQIKTTCLSDKPKAALFNHLKHYTYSSNSYVARRLNINTKESLKEYIEQTKNPLSFQQRNGSRLFSFTMSPFLSAFHKTQLKNDPKQFFKTAKHPFSVWVGKKLRLR